MGFISKIKNILFEEEEIEVPVTKTKEEKVVTPVAIMDAEEKLEKAKQTINKQESLSERELFKVDNTFNFPAFDEDEFESTLPKPKPKTVKEYPEERSKRAETVKHDFRIFEKDRDIKSNEKKKFKPSPVISPVYGILDKDYHPDEIMPKIKEDALKRSSGLDVDKVRNKAFGTLDDDLKDVIEQPKPISRVNKSYEQESALVTEKTLDELLEESAEETIIVDEDLELEKNIKEIEDELDKIDEEEPILDDKEKIVNDDDTLEQDLFELIDSMYDNKKEDEI